MTTNNTATNASDPKNHGQAANRNRASEPEELADQIEEIRAEIQNLTASITAAASSQVEQMHAKAQESIRENPFTAVAIGAALGFVYGALRR